MDIDYKQALIYIFFTAVLFLLINICSAVEKIEDTLKLYEIDKTEYCGTTT